MTTPVFTLTITDMMAYPEYQGNPNYVYQINWSYKGDDGTFSTAMSGSTNVPESDPQSFTPYNELTKEQVEAWIQEYTDPAIWPDFESKISGWITAQYTPPVVTPPLPWTQESTEPAPVTPEVIDIPVPEIIDIPVEVAPVANT